MILVVISSSSLSYGFTMVFRWETINAEVMNRSLGMHHAIIRKLLGLHRGWEQATEGDSFILMVRTYP